MKNRNVYLYWVGKEYKLISILRDLVYLHSSNGIGFNVKLITEKNLKEYIKYIPPYFETLCPAHQADFVRVHVICDYGGIWLDSDTLVIDKLDGLFDIIDKKNGFFIQENSEILWNGVFGSKPNTDLMLKWKTELVKTLNEKMNKIKWSEIGCMMLQKIYNDHSWLYGKYEIFDGLSNMYPIYWKNCVTEFIEKPYDNYKNIIRDNQPIVVLVNSVYKHLECKTRDEILKSRMPLNYFIDKSYENNRKVIYLKIAKNMGTTIVNFFKNMDEYYGESYFVEDWNHTRFFQKKIITLGHQTNIAKFKQQYFKIFDKAHKIIIFRNPLERMISGYNYLKYTKGYAYYLNKICRDISKSKKDNYCKHFIHFDETQLNSIDYESKTYHSELFFYIKQDDISKINNILNVVGIKKDFVNTICNSSSKSIFPDESSIILFNQRFHEDIEFYESIP